MNEEIVYSLASALILLVIHVSMSMRKMNRGRLNKAFISLIIFTFITAALDVVSLILDGDVTKPNSLKLVVIILSYTTRNLSYGLYTVYIIGVTDTGHIMGTGIRKSIMCIPLIGTLVASCSTLFNDYVFFIDSHGYFVRGKGISIIYAFNAVYLLTSVIIILIYWRNLGVKKNVALISCAVNATLAYVIGLVFPYLHFDLIAYTLGILFIMLIVMNPEARIDSQSGLMRHSAYFDDLKQGFFSNKKIYIIQINILHFEQISSMFSYEKLGTFINHLSQRLLIMCKRLSIPGECYYIKDGEFRIIIEKDKFNNIDKDTKIIFSIFNGEVHHKDINLDINSAMIVTRCPEDFSTFDTLYNFETRLKKFYSTDRVYDAKELINNKDYELISRMEEILDRALANGNLKVYYQPIFNPKEKKFEIAEALLRLYDEEYGEISPEVFIPIAETTGYMEKLENVVLHDICQFVQSDNFKKCGLKKIDMNLSIGQCLRADLAEKIKSVFDEYNLDPSVLYVGIIESIATESQKSFTDNIMRLDELGIGICIDDFGIGYSNIANISLLPITYVKFDRAFVNGNGIKQDAILASSVEMIKAIGKKVIIEGVESDDTVRKFDVFGCDYIQGFYYSKAIPVEQLVYFIQEFNMEQDALR